MERDKWRITAYDGKETYSYLFDDEIELDKIFSKMLRESKWEHINVERVVE